MYLVFDTITPIGVGQTNYFGVGHIQDAVEANAQHRVPFNCRIRNMRVHAGAAPGAGESYVYTFRLNGADTALTCTIAGAVNTTCEDLANYVDLVTDDLICMKIVTSAACAIVPHSVVLEVHN